ncbi:hypothetical protein IIY67_01255 [Candidatus Saccharibacteria bacterium]|nr:hypothetical protein [Candidatus Saccharibacteria bacterium]
MDKRLKNYQAFIAEAAKKPTAELIKFHQAELQQFQHERLIHLLVTLSFALFMLICFGAFLALCLMDWGDDMAGRNVIVYGMGGMTFLLLIVTLFYVRHYYLLENGVQRLEEYTAKLYGHDYGKRKKA